ncbi:Sec34-domain-containing protein [Microthyrium microscopicum]|uniref:Conserved oligomeric Golgi complex subunit 3 n=1 Tax=Microthyrium microscopicum TaxID=703497 RepID=A0A6A6TVW0_9PEZI|nr:Sec34-domain-containing protein [Microthyrium microscopicum]
MPDDGWYNSLAGKTSQPWQNPDKISNLAVRRRQTEGKRQLITPISANAMASTNNDRITTGVVSAPPIVRKVKSLSDFYDVVRNQMKEENREEKKKRRERSHLDNEIEFESWYDDMKEELIDASHAEYQLYQDQLSQTHAHLDSLLTSANSTLTILTSLADSFKAVDTQTTEFQAECENIIADQKRTSKLAEEFSENLQYYNYLEPITKRLNAPGAGSLVRRSEFPDMLSNLDACLEFMQSHPKHRESGAYAAKYKLLLTRALTLIRNHFTASLKDIAADVSKRVADRQLNDTTMSALLYAKFRVGAPDLKRLGQEIEIRSSPPEGSAPGTEGEYQGLLNELHQNYSATRAKLLSPIINRKTSEIAAAPSTSKDLVAFARTCTSFMRGLCSDEYNLWNEWFSDEHMLYPFLETLFDPVYDHLRPKIIHETKIIKLAELCTLIQTRYMEDSDSESEPESEEPKLDFGRLVYPALQDAQDRLVFLAQQVIRNDIQYFKPKPENLDYPRKASRIALSGTRNTSVAGRKDSNGLLSPTVNSPVIVEDDGADREVLFEPGTQEYYPTLRKAIWLLSRIYRLVHSTVFDSLAHEIVHQTTLSLTNASTLLSTRASPTDASLFLLAHLLALKHHILAFDIEYAATDVRLDFAAAPASLWASLNPATWVRAALGGALVPRVVTDMTDARIDIDDRLRAVIGSLVAEWAARMSEPLTTTATRGRTDVRAEADASARLRATVAREVPSIRRKLEEYLHDTRTRDMLLRAVLEDVVVRYTAWLEAKGLEAGPGPGRAKGKGREDGVWEEEMFVEWAMGVFGLEGGDTDDD